MAIDATYIYVAGYDSTVSAADSQWRIEKRDITTGALVTAFDTDGIVQVNPFVGDIDMGDFTWSWMIRISILVDLEMTTGKWRTLKNETK
jgi:hypothetical protein